MLIITIEVTEEDIRQGQVLKSWVSRAENCPVYLAAKRVIPDLVFVSSHCLIINRPNSGASCIPLPPEARQFIYQADMSTVREHNMLLQPFKFPVDIPETLSE